MIVRSENPNKSLIRAVAYRLMFQVGLKATSYTEIARNCSLGRPLVQRYFPKKMQILFDMVEDIFSSCLDVLQERHRAEPEEAKPLRVTQLYFSVLLRDEQSIQLARDVLSSRDSSGAILTAYYKSALLIGMRGDKDAMISALVRALGGVAELLVYRIDNSLPIQADEVAVQVVSTYRVLMYDELYSEAYSHAYNSLLPRNEIEDMVAEVLTRLLGGGERRR